MRNGNHSKPANKHDFLLVVGEFDNKNEFTRLFDSDWNSTTKAINMENNQYFENNCFIFYAIPILTCVFKYALNNEFY